MARWGVRRARNNGEDVTLSSARGIELVTLANFAKLAEIVRVARLEPAGGPGGRHLATSLFAGEDAAQGKEGQAGLAGLVQRR